MHWSFPANRENIREFINPTTRTSDAYGVVLLPNQDVGGAPSGRRAGKPKAQIRESAKAKVARR
jgi:hypothetical protein